MTKKIILVCTECLNRNYHIPRKTQSVKRIEVNKYCKNCNKHTLHKESR